MKYIAVLVAIAMAGVADAQCKNCRRVRVAKAIYIASPAEMPPMPVKIAETEVTSTNETNPVQVFAAPVVHYAQPVSNYRFHYRWRWRWRWRVW